MAYLSEREQAWWNCRAERARTVKFNSEINRIADELTCAITIPRIKRALGMYSEFYIQCKRKDLPWMRVYNLDHIRHLAPSGIRVMLFITNLGLSYAETAARLNISERCAAVMCREAWRNLTEQWRLETKQTKLNHKVARRSFKIHDPGVSLKAA